MGTGFVKGENKGEFLAKGEKIKKVKNKEMKKKEIPFDGISYNR